MTNETIKDATEDLQYNYIVGIDLGTTNSAVAYVDLTSGKRDDHKIRFLNIPQLKAPGEIDTLPVLPSFLYISGPHDLPEGSIALPWDKNRNYAVGEFAREQGFLVPGRLVSSAKSWLCHGGVDRTSNILPWGKDIDVKKISPVEASTRYLLHIREAWNEVIAQGKDGCALEEQMVMITVPASFDEVARELTVKAARAAGFNNIKLMEEPLAAFYAWLYRNKQDARQEKMEPGQLILVCDVGGGTTDFTIISVVKDGAELKFNRLSVGDHLMLGGDNIDLTIARFAETKLFGKPGQLDTKRWIQLTHQCRKAKEVLLSENCEVKEMDITLMGSGGKLIANTLKCSITADEIKDMIVDGFFPHVPLENKQITTARKGLTEWGLPYVQNPKVTDHLAAFWQQSRPLLEKETGRECPYPDFLLFNGGSLIPAIIRDRIRSVVQKWFKDKAGEDWMPEELDNPTPELAVAIGAVNYGVAKLFDGVKVGAGSPCAYYVEVGAAADNEEQDTKLRKSVCLVPRNSEEGFEIKLDKPQFEVMTNRQVSFHVFTSSTRLEDNIGDIVELPEQEITILPPIHTVLKYGKKGEAKPLPINLSVRLNEVGTLELWCTSREGAHNWQLQFDVRIGGDSKKQMSSGETFDSATTNKVCSKIIDVFGTKEGSSPESVIKEITSVLSLSKAAWPTFLIRKIADSLLEHRKGRCFSPQHESRWLNVLGYCLRPGFGDPLDEWRIKEMWKIFLEGLKFPDKYQCLSEWWIFWRRIAGGLKASHQMEIYKQLSPYLQSSANKKKGVKRNLKKKSSSHDELEIWMTLASFERLDADIKEKLGRQLLQKFRRRNPEPKEIWSLSRLGSRVPFHGPLDKVISVGEVSNWINTIVSSSMEITNALAHAIVQLARNTGDRERDISQTDKDKLFDWIDKLPDAQHFKELIDNPESALDQKEQDWIFGEGLPPGLVIS
ncbi:MAG: Hsp70 family protein, partial [Candidatus Anammoxibacter sp.]